MCPSMLLASIFRESTHPDCSGERKIAPMNLQTTSQGPQSPRLQTPYRDGTTQVAFEPVDFVARLAALVPKPRVNLTRYHGVLAPNHRWRGLVTPTKRGRGVKSISNAEVRSSAERHAARACPALSGMTWAQRLKRIFSIDIEVCSRCGGSVKVIACIQDLDIIDRILAYLRREEQDTPTPSLLIPPTRAPPARCLFSSGRKPHFLSSTSKDATENPVGIDSCMPRPGVGRHRSIMGAILVRYRDVQ